MLPVVAIAVALSTLGSGAPTAWTPVTQGIEHTTLRVKGTRGLGSTRLHAFRVDLARYKLAPVDARRRGRTRATVETLANERRLMLVINGTYFDERDRPLGLLLGETGELNPLRRADWGVFHVTSGRAGLVHTSDWRQLEPKPREFAIQVGPRCVIDGEIVRLKPQVARRAALCVQRSGHVVFAVSSGELLSSDLARAMAASEASGGLGCRDAVMLDGGGSAQLWAQIGERRWHVPGAWPVPNGIAVVPR